MVLDVANFHFALHVGYVFVDNVVENLEVPIFVDHCVLIAVEKVYAFNASFFIAARMPIEPIAMVVDLFPILGKILPVNND